MSGSVSLVPFLLVKAFKNFTETGIFSLSVASFDDCKKL